jgi:DNA-binding PadR family transcriptional regulator
MIIMAQALEYFAGITDEEVALKIIKYLLSKEGYVLYRDIKRDLPVGSGKLQVTLYYLEQKGAIHSEWENLSDNQKMRKFTLTEKCRDMFQKLYEE